MFKSVLKETFIMLLLCVAIVLILGVIFYNYIPTNKTIPNKLAEYTTPENIKTEINQLTAETEKQEISYEIDGTDLKLFRQTNSYTTGKPNPFSASTTVDNTQNNTNNNTNNNNTNNNTNNNSNTNTNVDPKSTGTFYEDKGTK
mgnify:CR=1 FL=1